MAILNLPASPVNEKWIVLLDHPDLRDLLRARLLQLAFEQDAGTAVRAVEMFLGLGTERRASPYGGLSVQTLTELRQRAEAWIQSEASKNVSTTEAP